MGVTFYMDWEVRLIEWMQSFDSALVRGIWLFFTSFGELFPLVILIGLLYWSFDKELGKRVYYAFILALMISIPIKAMILRRRPYMDHESIQCIKKPRSSYDPMDVDRQGYSFPSGHSTFSSSAAFTFGQAQKRLPVRIFFGVLPFFVGLSRLFMGVHYPTDVIAGLAVGTLGFLVTGLLWKKTDREWIRYAIVIAAAVPLLIIYGTTELAILCGAAIGGFSGFMFEARYVKFENADTVRKKVLRFVFGMLAFSVSAGVPFLVFGALFGHGALRDGLSVLIAAFVIMGIYPMFINKSTFLK